MLLCCWPGVRGFPHAGGSPSVSRSLSCSAAVCSLVFVAHGRMFVAFAQRAIREKKCSPLSSGCPRSSRSVAGVVEAAGLASCLERPAGLSGEFAQLRVSPPAVRLLSACRPPSPPAVWPAVRLLAVSCPPAVRLLSACCPSAVRLLSACRPPGLLAVWPAVRLLAACCSPAVRLLSACCFACVPLSPCCLSGLPSPVLSVKLFVCLAVWPAVRLLSAVLSGLRCAVPMLSASSGALGVTTCKVPGSLGAAPL